MHRIGFSEDMPSPAEKQYCLGLAISVLVAELARNKVFFKKFIYKATLYNLQVKALWIQKKHAAVWFFSRFS